MKRLVWSLVVVCSIAVSASCKKGGSSSKSPVSPGNTTLLGIWTGTLTRPGGLPPMNIRWETPNLDGFSLVGPVTVTNSGGASAQATGQGNTAGNDSSGYTLYMSFMSDAVAPNCTVRGATAGSQTGDPFPSPYHSISIPAFRITYTGCTALVGQTSNLEETGQLTLTKQ